jgi:hypothetical protein
MSQGIHEFCSHREDVNSCGLGRSLQRSSHEVVSDQWDEMSSCPADSEPDPDLGETISPATWTLGLQTKEWNISKLWTY